MFISIPQRERKVILEVVLVQQLQKESCLLLKNQDKKDKSQSSSKLFTFTANIESTNSSRKLEPLLSNMKTLCHILGKLEALISAGKI